MFSNQVAIDRHHELAGFLRSRRARVSPEQVGLPRGARRRTPGLRREEVAMLVGVSPEWYTWLEQGRDINVSVQVLDRLTRVLQLDANERIHVFLLALNQPPPLETFVPPTISTTVQQFLDRLGTTPACAVDARMNVVAWNAAHCAVFWEQVGGAERDRNLVWRLFTNDTSRQANQQWEELARVYVAQFRAEYGRFINDPWWAEQITALSQISSIFRELWARQDVSNVSEGQKVFHHSVAGELVFDFLWLQAVNTGDLRMLIHTPRADTGTAEKIERLLVCAAKESAPNE